MKKYPVGEAIFFPFTMHFAGLKDLRRHTYHALLAGIIPERFFIAAEETAPAGSLDLFFSQQKSNWNQLLGKMAGKHYGAFQCAAIWNGSLKEGLLLHNNRKELLCAYLPAVTKGNVLHDLAIVQQIESLAFLSGEMDIQFDHRIHDGEWKMRDLLNCIAGQIRDDLFM